MLKFPWNRALLENISFCSTYLAWGSKFTLLHGGETWDRFEGGGLGVWSLFDFAKFCRFWSLFAKNAPKSWKTNIFRRKIAIFKKIWRFLRQKLVTSRFCTPPPFGGPPNQSLVKTQRKPSFFSRWDIYC